jgi:hypothetical protein
LLLKLSLSLSLSLSLCVYRKGGAVRPNLLELQPKRRRAGEKEKEKERERAVMRSPPEADQGT